MIGTILNDRYRIEAEIGRGGMGVVYRAQDTLLKRSVAVKVVSAADLGSEGRSRLLQEARAAARLTHPHIVAVHDVGQVEGADHSAPISYIVMELVEGQSLREYQPRDLTHGIDLAIKICEALAAAHAQGIIHRDLKPENVTVTHSGTIKLMDFGLARITGQTRLTQEGTFMGTVSYLAPEVILGQDAESAADLYSLGVMLYEMSAGRPPFEADNLTAVLSQHLYAPVVPPSAYNERVPAALDKLIVGLLGKRPEDRPPSAESVTAALEEISQTGEVPETPTALPQLKRLVRGRMVGREAEFGEAAALWRAAAAGNGQLLLISGEPGIGKTRLVKELTAYAEISGGKTLIGRCYAEERAPYGPIAQMVQSSLENGFHLDLTGSFLAALSTLSPELRVRFADIPARERLDLEEEQQRLFDSIVAWFNALTEAGQTLLVVDDVHWADSGSLNLLRYLARRLEGRPALVVATYREGELDRGLPFRDVLKDLNRERLAARIKLGRMDKEKTRDLLAALFEEEITPDFLDGIYRETEGNPFFVEEVCKALVDSGKLYFEGGRWHRPDDMAELEIPQGIRLTIQSRLARLSDEERETLTLAALLGRKFEYEMLAAVSDLNEGPLIDALENVDGAQIIEEIRGSTSGTRLRFNFTHALIHSTLLADLSTLRRQRLQRRVALALEASFPERKGELAPLLGRYFAEAGEVDKGVTYLLMSGDAAREVFAYQEAIEAYESALLLLQSKDDHERAARTLMKLGLTYHNVYAFEAAQKAYDQGFAAWQNAAASESAIITAQTPAPHPFRRAWLSDPATLDSALTADEDSAWCVGQLFSGLVQLTADDELVPDVAQRWEVLDGGRTYIFHLRDDVRWSDGTPVTAADFEYAWKRVLHPENDQGLPETLFDIQGAEAYKRGLLTDPSRVGVRAADDYRLVVELEGPCGYFLQLLTTDVSKPVPRHIVKRLGNAWCEPANIITNGPFKLRSLKPGQSMTFERYEDYHGRFKGNVSQVKLRIAPGEAALTLYERDELDILNPYYHLSVQDGQRTIQRHPDDYISGPAPVTHFLGFNVRRPPFDDPRVRRALVLAIDREGLENRHFRGLMFPAGGGMVPAGLPGHVPGIALPFDPALARETLAQAGQPGGKGWPAVKGICTSTLARRLAFEVLSAGWKEHLGLQVNVEAVDSFLDLRNRMKGDPPDLWLAGWAADYPDPDNFLRIASWLRDSGWHNEQYEDLVNEARRFADQGRRMAMYRQAEQILVEEAPVVPLRYGRNHTLVKPWLRGLPVSMINGDILKDIVIEPHE